MWAHLSQLPPLVSVPTSTRYRIECRYFACETRTTSHSSSWLDPEAETIFSQTLPALHTDSANCSLSLSEIATKRKLEHYERTFVMISARHTSLGSPLTLAWISHNLEEALPLPTATQNITSIRPLAADVVFSMKSNYRPVYFQRRATVSHQSITMHKFARCVINQTRSR